MENKMSQRTSCVDKTFEFFVQTCAPSFQAPGHGRVKVQNPEFPALWKAETPVFLLLEVA